MCAAFLWSSLSAQVFDSDRKAVSDEELCAMLQERLHVDASKAFSSSQNNGSPAPKQAHMPQKGALQQGCKALTVDEFVSRTLPLLELEQEAEVAQVKSSTLLWACQETIYLYNRSLSCCPGCMSGLGYSRCCRG